jgi:hypothetical protein
MNDYYTGRNRMIRAPEKIVIEQSLSVVSLLYDVLLSRRMCEYEMTLSMLAPKADPKSDEQAGLPGDLVC